MSDDNAASRMPAEVFPPGEFIRDEMAARGWSIEDMHAKLNNDPFRCCCFDLIAFVDKKELVLDGRTAGDLATLFGTSSLYWIRLDRSWRGGISEAR